MELTYRGDAAQVSILTLVDPWYLHCEYRCEDEWSSFSAPSQWILWLEGSPSNFCIGSHLICVALAYFDGIRKDDWVISVSCCCIRSKAVSGLQIRTALGVKVVVPCHVGNVDVHMPRAAGLSSGLRCSQLTWCQLVDGLPEHFWIAWIGLTDLLADAMRVA